MTEWEIKRPETAEQWSNHISEFAHKWEFGTPGFYAVNDFVNLQRLYGQIGEEQHSQLARVSGEANLSQEDRLNLTLQRIALLEHTIQQNQARIPGYSSASLEISTSFQDMIGAAVEEARTKYSNEEEKQTAYVQKIYGETLDAASQSVFEKQNPL